MALPTSGNLTFTQIYNEIFGSPSVPNGTTLEDLAIGANNNGCKINNTTVNFTLPHSMSEFYGLDCSNVTVPTGAFQMEIVGSSFTISFNLSTELVVTQSNRHTIYWGDGTTTVLGDSYDGFLDFDISHTYSLSGTYTITVASDGDIFNNGRINGLNIGSTSATNRAKLRKVTNWGKFAFLSNVEGDFKNCTNLTVTANDNPELDAKSSFSSAFLGCTSLTTIPTLNNWNVGVLSGAFLGNMFNGCTNWNQDISGWDVTGLLGLNSLFINNTSFSTANYDLLLISWASQSLQSNVTISFDPCYNDSTSRNTLTTTYNWNITDDNICIVTTPPTNLRLSDYSVDENTGSGAFIATILSDGGQATYSIASGGNSANFNITNGNELRTVFNFSASNSPYSVVINATNSAGSVQENFNITVNQAFGIPTAPSNLSATNTAGQSTISLAWDDNSSNEDGFRLEVSVNNGTYSFVTNLNQNITSYTDATSKFNNSTYTYRVRSYNTSGASSWTISNTITISTGGGSQ